MRSVRHFMIGVAVGSMLVLGTAGSSAGKGGEPADVVAATGGSAEPVERADVVAATGGGSALPRRPVLPAIDPIPSSRGTEVPLWIPGTVAVVGLGLLGGYAMRRRRHHLAVS